MKVSSIFTTGPHPVDGPMAQPTRWGYWAHAETGLVCPLYVSRSAGYRQLCSSHREAVKWVITPDPALVKRRHRIALRVKWWGERVLDQLPGLCVGLAAGAILHFIATWPEGTWPR